jgi:hypothetical protein
MRIFLTIFEDKTNKNPEKYEFIGNWALETMMNKLLSKYYGSRIATKVEDLLRERI